MLAICVLMLRLRGPRFVSNVQNLLRKPSEEEAILGSNVLAIMSLIFGADDERFFQRSKNVLRPLAKAARNPKVKATVRSTSP